MAKFDSLGNKIDFLAWQKLPSDVPCRCGCGRMISNRAARNVEKGKPNAGYIHGHIWKGRTLPESIKAKMRENHVDVRGDKNPNFGGGLHGPDNPNWQGGKTLRYGLGGYPGMNTSRDLEFRKMIRDRDGKCVLCGNTSKLQVHHIYSWIDHEELRFDQKNCVTLCPSCHCRADNAHHQDEIRPMLLAYVDAATP